MPAARRTDAPRSPKSAAPAPLPAPAKARSGPRRSPARATAPAEAPPEPWDAGPPLNEKQTAFLHRLLLDPTEPATRAYMAVYECSYEAALNAGPRLLGNARIRRQLEQARAERAERTASDADRVVRELTHIASADLTDIWESTPPALADGDRGAMRLKPLAEWPVEARRAIVGMRIKRVPEKKDGDGMVIEEAHEVMEIKLANKVEALRLLGLHHGAKFTRAPVDGDGKAVAPIQQTMIIAGQAIVFT